MPPPSISMNRPLRSRDPGPSIPDAPGRCPLHQGQLGWNMLLPCEACIALAFVPADLSANSVVVKNDKNDVSIIFGKNDTSIIFDNSYAASGVFHLLVTCYISAMRLGPWILKLMLKSFSRETG